MKQSNKKHILMRYSLIVGFMLLFSTLIIYDMFKTTVVYGSLWNKKAAEILSDTTIIEPERGMILADDGSVLAANLRFFTARIDWKTSGFDQQAFTDSLPALCDSLHSFDPSKTQDQWRNELLAAKAKGKRAYRLFSRLSHSEYKRVKSFPFFNMKPGKTGLYAELKMSRCKPYGKMASRSIGSTGEDKTSKSIHGRSGLEMALDTPLYGVPGQAKRIQLTNSIVDWENVPAVKGYDITTTINIQLQDIVENELYSMLVKSEAQWGTAVLMEVATGEIKAISNLEKNEEGTDYVEGRNNAVTGYEPGSVMKPISMLVALEDGIVKSIDEQWATGSVWNYCNRPIKDHYGSATLSPKEIIERSSNIGMSKIIISKYGENPDGFRKRLEQMGFFDEFHSGIGGEMIPRFPKLKNDNGGRISLSRMAFGYTTEIPPLRTLAIYNAIANDGKFVRPHLVKKYSREGQPDSIVPVTYIREHICSPENAAKLRQCLREVVWGSRGTARKWVQDERVMIAGKTGTAYTLEGGHYGSQKRYAFCGFFPYDKPKYSCMVLIRGGQIASAGASSGTVLKNIALRMYARGMLGTDSDYKANNENADKQPRLFATLNPERNKNLRNGIGLGALKVFAKAKDNNKGVPNVLGLNVRDAVATLERRGINVRVHGNGCVTGQSLAAGSAYHRGDQILLTLR